MSTIRRFSFWNRGLLLLVVLGGGCFLALRALDSYKVDLVHRIIVRSVVQKALPEFPVDRIESAFGLAREGLTSDKEEEEYIAQLLRLSQRLEKVQSLTTCQIEQILNDL